MSQAKDERTVPYELLWVFLLVVVGIVVAGTSYYRSYQRHFRTGVERQLSAIAELKVDELARWRNERLEDAHFIFNNTNLPAVKAALGQEGIVEGEDYRGVPVVAALRRVPDSPWFLVARMDLAEMHAPLRERPWLTNLIAAVLLLGAGASLAGVWRHQRVCFYKERLSAAESLRASEARYRSLFDNMFEAVACCRMLFEQGQPQDFIYLAANRAFETLTGLKGVVGKRVSEVIPGLRHTDPGLFEIYGRVARGGAPERFETYVEALEMWRSVSVYSPGPDLFVVVFDVITERKRAEEALRKSERNYREIFNATHDAIFVHDAVTGEILDVNQAVLDMYGYSRQELAAMNGEEFRFSEPYSHEEAVRRIRLAFAEGPQVFEWESKRKSGERFWTEVALRGANLDGQGRVLAVVRDITERKAAKSDLRLANEELELRKTSILDLLEDLKAELEAQKRIEKALRNSEALYQSLVENIPQCILRKDRAGRFVFANQNFCQFIGLSSEQLLGQTAAEVGPPELARKLREDDQRVMDTGQGLELVEEIITGQGCRFMQVIKSPVRDAGGQVVGVQAIFWDITARRQMEERVAQLLREQQAILDTAPVGIALYKGRTVDWANPALKAMFGYASEDLHGMDMPALYVHTEDYERMGREGPARVGQGLTYTVEVELKRKSGARFWCQVQGRAIDPTDLSTGVIWMVMDVTEQKKAQEDLARREAELAAIYDSSPLMMCLVNRQREVERMNHAMAQFGATDGSAESGPQLGDALGCVNALDDPRGCGFGARCQTCPLRLAVVKTFETGQPCRQVEAEMFLAQSGNRREIQVSASTAFVRLQDQPKVLVCLEDVTDRKQLQAQFLHAQKMEAIGQLAGGVAHDFNNILAAALLHLQLLQRRQNLEPELAASLRELQQGTERAASLTRQLLLFSRRQVVQTTRLDFNEVIKGLLKMLKRLLGEDIDTVFSPGPGPVWVEADVGMLEQVVMNLCVNARDAMPKGGHLELGARRLALGTEDVRHRPEARPGHFACFTITDTGCGMDETTLRRIFEPFFTTKEPGKGTGLGLATVQSIARQHHGWIEVESALGRGTTFRVFLPVADSPEAAQRQADQVKCRGGTETILLVEDDEQVRRMVRMTLRLFGYEILEAGNGLEAIQVWGRHGAQVSQVFTDMVMPGGIRLHPRISGAGEEARRFP
jgi:PAS domain S-box-containing protein